MLPVGGINVTNDVAIGLRTSLNLAEEIKIKHGTANMAEVEPEELLNVAVLGESAGQTIQRRKLCEIIEARMGEIFSLIREEVKRSGHAGMLPAGAVLTGGGARLAGVEVLARETLEMPVRVGSPQGVGGLMDQIEQKTSKSSSATHCLPRPVRRVRRILYRPQPDMGGSRETHWTYSHVLQGCDRP